MPSVKASYNYLAFLGLLLFIAACSVEKNTGASRFYHGMTARYNIYFNGYESFKEGLIKIENGYRDDYAEVLKVFEFSDPSTPALCSSDMERAIQKASKLISLKSITAKPEIKEKGKSPDLEANLLERKEYNEWVDDSYLLIGKARFYKQEYNAAASIFNYCITQANSQEIRLESSIWLARVNNETGKYSEAYRTLSEMNPAGGFSRSLKSMYYTSLADHFIKQKKYTEAIDPLSKAVDLVSGKRTKYRLTYLLAQLNGFAGNSDKAIALYRQVVKMNPPYDVEFNARINIAGVFDINSGNPQALTKELQKMLKDSKNKEFLDQIYFALGSLSMKEGNEKEALQFFRKSASAPSRNANQKGRSYRALAEYFFRKNDFLNAAKYYDSTVYFLDQKHPEYQFLKLKSQDLNTIVSQLKIIQKEDSLQKVAAMTESERNTFISSIISNIVKAEGEGKSSQYSDRYNLGQYYENERRFQDNIEQEGKWYFYNQTALTFGRTEFRRRWGDRKLEDNWRRANRTRGSSSFATEESGETTQKSSDTLNEVIDYKNPKFYLRDLPLDDSLLAASDERIANAYLNAGKAYAEKLADTGRATESLENLLSRYPGNELIPEALYNLYQINKEINNSRSEAYRQRLLEKYPDTEFAKILSDPAYYDNKIAKMKMVEQLYQQAYESYTKENFVDAISQCDDAIKKQSGDPLVPKFMLLRAYSVARINDEKAFKDELVVLIKSWPESNESVKAKEIISFLNQKLPELKVEEDKEIARDLFVSDTTRVHLFTLIIEDPSFNINLATFDVISYNIDNFTNKNYRTEGTLVDNKYIMINVTGFRNYRQALDYYNSFNIDKLVRNTSGSKMFSFIISLDNLKALNTDKNPERYLLFFQEKYINEKI